jgi:hypothetical protein
LHSPPDLQTRREHERRAKSEKKREKKKKKKKKQGESKTRISRLTRKFQITGLKIKPERVKVLAVITAYSIQSESVNDKIGKYHHLEDETYKRYRVLATLDFSIVFSILRGGDT